jgi:NTP pyrophosphatase (non-canonical NTP hydrolase)
MDFKTYQSLSVRTCADLGSMKLNLAHMSMGITSELAELEEAIEKQDKVNIGEEIADIHWYLSNYCTFRGLDYSDLGESCFKTVQDFKNTNKSPLSGENSPLNALYRVNSYLADLVKKYVAYDKEINLEEEDYVLRMLLLESFTLLKSWDIDINVCLQNNVNKLIIRYADKFNNHSALNRDLMAERKELENGN